MEVFFVFSFLSILSKEKRLSQREKDFDRFLGKTDFGNIDFSKFTFFDVGMLKNDSLKFSIQN